MGIVRLASKLKYFACTALCEQVLAIGSVCVRIGYACKRNAESRFSRSLKMAIQGDGST
jgi:hypothetical protein